MASSDSETMKLESEVLGKNTWRVSPSSKGALRTVAAKKTAPAAASTSRPCRLMRLATSKKPKVSSGIKAIADMASVRSGLL